MLLSSSNSRVSRSSKALAQTVLMNRSSPRIETISSASRPVSSQVGSIWSSRIASNRSHHGSRVAHFISPSSKCLRAIFPIHHGNYRSRSVALFYRSDDGLQSLAARNQQGWSTPVLFRRRAGPRLDCYFVDFAPFPQSRFGHLGL